MSNCIRIDPLTPAVSVGRGIHWDSKTQALYFVDTFNGTVHSYTPACDRFITATVGCSTQLPLAGIIPIEGQKHSFIISVKNNICCVKWDGIACHTSEPNVIVGVEPEDNNNRINSIKVDPKGRLWAGTTGRRLSDKELIFEEGLAGLYIMKKCGEAQKLAECISVAAGMEWTCDKRFFYFTDSANFTLDLYDYCNQAGKICNPRTVFKMNEHKTLAGTFDGLALDCNGLVYIANYLGCQVCVYDPNTCKLVNAIKIPAKEVISLCWGGKDNDILFVSTGNTEPTPKYPCAGRIFKVCGLGAKGVPSRNVILQS